ncbi:MAG TPA: inositol monophosphatase family protein [Candidatus Saccharimonadales bacterium]|nr:inositol monophosphatase family protein [Candidatus Saccharimonadales bacterium]
MPDISNRLRALREALNKAGQEILKYDPATVVTNLKANAGDLVTAADLASEKVIIEAIKSHFPEDLVISEETTTGQELLNEKNLEALTGWVIDPIDGTNNFKHGFAYSGISIGYIMSGQPVLGGILDPYKDLVYIASKGKGATCNDKPIHVSNIKEFNAGTRVCTSNSSAGGGTQANLERYKALGDVWVDVLGSAVLIMVDVASGRLDLYHHNGLKPWDNAAGFLIAEEAGAKIVGLNGQPVSWLSSEVVLGNPDLVDRFIALTAS